MNIRKMFFIALCAYLSAFPLFSQVIDSDFNFDARKDASVGDIVFQDDGKFLVSGGFDFCGDHISRTIGRFNSDGTPDESFSSGSGVNDVIRAIALQSDGKIIIGGKFTSYDGNPINNIARLNQDGSFDSSFNSGSGFTNVVSTISIDQEDKILVGSGTGEFDGIVHNGLLRLNSDGSFDESFAPLVIEGLANTRIDFQSDGKIIVLNRGWGGERIMRVNTDGSLDYSWKWDVSVSTLYSYAVLVLPDDRIVVSVVNYTDEQRAVIITDANGKETQYINMGVLGEITFRFVYNNNQDKIFFGYRSVNQLDLSTNEITTYFNNSDSEKWIRDMAMHSDSTLLIVGGFNDYGNVYNRSIAKFGVDGLLDENYPAFASRLGTISSIVKQDDGKVIIGGDFNSINETLRNNLARLEEDGKVDSTFQSGILEADEKVYEILLLEDGSILTGLYYSKVDNQPGIRKFLSDGSLASDFSFTAAYGNGYIRKMILGNDQKIYIGSELLCFECGIFIPGSGIELSARINMDGSLDPNYMSINFSYDRFFDIHYTQDNKILLAGTEIKVDGKGPFNLVRLNADFSLDPTFNPIGELNDPNINLAVIRDIEELDNGQYIVSGIFQYLDSIDVSNAIFRINKDGTIDDSFAAGSGFEDTDFAIASQIQKLNDDSYLVSGRFTSYNDIEVNNIIMINKDGELMDCDFSASVGEVEDIAFIDETSVYLAGNFEVNSDQIEGGVRFVDIGCSLVDDLTEIEPSSNWFSISPNPAWGYLDVNLTEFEGQNAEINLSIFNALGARISTESFYSNGSNLNNRLDINMLEAGTYILHISTESRTGVLKFVKI